MYKLKWDNITSVIRVPNTKKEQDASSYRSEVESDYFRIVKSASYRRLQDKTQVFPLDKSDFVRTRLTHSYEVCAIAKIIGKQVCSGISTKELEPKGEIPNVLEVNEILNCAGLLHDIGNPPFGHFGEMAIRGWFCRNLNEMKMRGQPLSSYLTPQQKYDLERFEGNAQALRVTCKLHRLIGTNGMRLTSAVLDCIIKYPSSSLMVMEDRKKEKCDRSLLRKKVGYFFSETDVYTTIKNNTGAMDIRNPLTYILEAADDLAYTFADLEDGYNKNLFTYDDLLTVIQTAMDETGEKLLSKYLEDGNKLKNVREEGFNPYKYAIFTWLTMKQMYCISTVAEAFLKEYDKIMNGIFEDELINVCKEAKVIAGLKKLAFTKVYQTSSVQKLELMGNEIINFLMDRFLKALVNYDTEIELDEIDKKYIALLSDNYLDNYHRTVKGNNDEGERLYHRLLLATDFISGMTDSYAKDLYRELNGI